MVAIPCYCRQFSYATVTAGQHLYSIGGYIIQLASPSQKLIWRVECIRDTRTFQTRHLRVVKSKGKSEQLCLIATADFHIDEPVDIVNYSSSPQLTVPTPPVAETETEETQEPGLYNKNWKHIRDF